MKRLVFFIVPLLAASPLLAQPAGYASSREALLQQRREKLKEKWEKQFRAADTDNSGTLTREECIKAGLPQSLIDHFDEIDTNHDGVLTPQELMSMYEKRLQAQESTKISSPDRVQ
ncbi:MAG: hypothetical protein ACRETW_13515 [Stenotrophobium sp.]